MAYRLRQRPARASRCGARAAVSYGFATSRLPTHANRVTARLHTQCTDAHLRQIHSYSAKLLTFTFCGVKLLSINAGQPIEPLSLALFTEALQPALESVERHLHF